MQHNTAELCERVAKIEGKLDNGITARIRFIERMQWWQIGIMVVIIGGLVAGMWTMLRQGSATARENQKLLLDHVRGVPYIEAPAVPGGKK